MTLALRVVSHSEVGLVRKNNQDSGYASPRLVVVADGMGGAAAGDLASAVAVDTLMRRDGEVTAETMLETLAEAVAEANDRIADLIESDVALDGMGTTVTAALFDGAELGLAHIGDSRAYLMREGVLLRLTHDHSWVQSLVDEGKISREEAAVHPHRSLLLRVVNGQASSQPELSRVPVQAGDRLMLCSDGLCGLVDDPVIAELLALPDRGQALDALVGQARAEGGVDNITVIVADVEAAASGADRVARAATGSGAVGSDPVGSGRVMVLGAAAATTVPPGPGRAGRVEAVEDTLITGRLPSRGATALAAPPGPAPSAATPEEGLADETRYNPQPPPRRRRVLRPLLAVLVVALIGGAGLGTAYAWTRTQFYVGVSAEQVTIYRGLSDGLPGIPLSSLYEVQALPVAQLPPYYQEKVRASIDVSSLEAARQTVDELREAAARCAGTAPGTGTPGTATPGTAPTGPSTSSPRVPSTSRPTPAAASPSVTGPGC